MTESRWRQGPPQLPEAMLKLQERIRDLAVSTDPVNMEALRDCILRMRMLAVAEAKVLNQMLASVAALEPLVPGARKGLQKPDMAMAPSESSTDDAEFRQRIAEKAKRRPSEKVG